MTTSQLVGILPGDPPRLNLVDHATGRNGVKRHFAHQVPVLDESLFARLQAEVNIGDCIHATTVNEYTERGSRVYLADFQKVNNTATNGTGGMKNTAHDMSQFPLAMSVIEPVIEPVTQPKPKVRH